MQPKIEQKEKTNLSLTPSLYKNTLDVEGVHIFECRLRVGGALLSHDLNRSTIGAGWLNFRVRYGTGCTPPAKTADPQGTFGICCFKPHPEGRTARS